MKKTSLFLLLLIASSLCALAQDAAFPQKDRKVSSIYDEKTDTTIVRFGAMHVANLKTGTPFSYAKENGELRLSGFFTYKGRTLIKPESIGLLFTSTNLDSNLWQLSKQKDLEITADGRHWNIPEVKVLNSHKNTSLMFDSQKSTALIFESLDVSIPCDVFVKIANAKKVKIRLGDREFDLVNEHLGALRELAAHAGC